MLQLGKIATLLFLRRNTEDKSVLLHSFLTGLAAVAGLALVIAILTGGLILGSIFYAHKMLLVNGIDAYTAMAITGLTLAVLIAGLTYMVINKIDELKTLPTRFAKSEAPVAFNISGIAQSFMDGLNNKHTNNRSN